MLNIRTAEEQDFERIMEIYHIAQDYMISSGNPNQWMHSHPAPELIRSDIQRQISKVVYDEAGIHGVFALLEGEDPTYGRIEGGSWLNDAPYLTIHRIAGDGQAHGVFRCAVDYCKRLSPNIRIDTHADNRTMQALLAKNGFVRCGTIYLMNGSPRIAYQWAAD